MSQLLHVTVSMISMNLKGETFIINLSFVSLTGTDVCLWSITICLQLGRRPHPTFMEAVQRDITQTMRGILVDWLVEVTIFSLLEVTVVKAFTFRYFLCVHNLGCYL